MCSAATVSLHVYIEDTNWNELLLTGKTDLHWDIEGKPQEVLELSYDLVQGNKEGRRLESFIPQIWDQVQKRRIIERYRQMREENASIETPGYYDPRDVGYVRLNNEDAISRKTLDRLLGDTKQFIMPYDPDHAVRFYPRTPLPEIAQVIGFGEIRYDEATLFTEEAVNDLMNRISRAFGIGGSEVGELYDNWKQEYVLQDNAKAATMQRGRSAQLGYFPNPLTVPQAVPGTAPTPTHKPEPEFGVVVANKAQVPLSTENALLSGKFINEGETIDVSFKQYIVLFHNDDYNRGEAVQVRQQLRDLIPGVDVVLMPINGS